MNNRRNQGFEKRRASGFDRDKKEFEEMVVDVARVSRTVAGGRRIRFRVAVVVGNKKGKVGIGIAKSSEVVGAVSKAVKVAKKNLIEVMIKNGTIAYEIQTSFGGAKVLLKPAVPGTGLVAGGAVRIVANLCGITNLSAKILGSSNKVNCLKATMIALDSLPKESTDNKAIEEEQMQEKKLKKVKTVKAENKSLKTKIGQTR